MGEIEGEELEEEAQEGWNHQTLGVEAQEGEVEGDGVAEVRVDEVCGGGMGVDEVCGGGMGGG